METYRDCSLILACHTIYSWILLKTGVTRHLVPIIPVSVDNYIEVADYDYFMSSSLMTISSLIFLFGILILQIRKSPASLLSVFSVMIMIVLLMDAFFTIYWLFKRSFFDHVEISSRTHHHKLHRKMIAKTDYDQDPYMMEIFVRTVYQNITHNEEVQYGKIFIHAYLIAAWVSVLIFNVAIDIGSAIYFFGFLLRLLEDKRTQHVHHSQPIQSPSNNVLGFQFSNRFCCASAQSNSLQLDTLPS